MVRPISVTIAESGSNAVLTTLKDAEKLETSLDVEKTLSVMHFYHQFNLFDNVLSD